MSYWADGPAVMLCDPTGIVFPAQLAAFWRSKGMEVVFVTHRHDAPPSLPDGTRLVRSCDYETPLTRRVTRWLMNPVLWRLDRTAPWFKKRFTKKTGASADSELWLPYIRNYVTNAWPASRAALAQHPRFVFGQEVTCYGLSTSFCCGVPRIIFPWGGDVFTYAESSPFQFALTKLSLRSVDLIVPASTTAARHICERFGVPPDKVHAISWGVDRKIFKRADADKRKSLLAKWRIEPGALVFLNSRRFRPAWGALVALEAFMRLASEHSSAHFILLAGHATEEFMRDARNRLKEAGLLSRFTLLDGHTPLEVCAELMSISDAFTSLLGRGDMRSSSVIQAAASGGLPVISDIPEYREMERLGFAGLFVRPDSVEDVLGALRFIIRNPDTAREIVTRNEAYIAEHEDHFKQMTKMLSLIEAVCTDYAVRKR